MKTRAEEGGRDSATWQGLFKINCWLKIVVTISLLIASSGTFSAPATTTQMLTKTTTRARLPWQSGRGATRRSARVREILILIPKGPGSWRSNTKARLLQGS